MIAEEPTLSQHEEKGDDTSSEDLEKRGLQNRIAACNIVKEEGNTLFTQNDFEGALKKYERVSERCLKYQSE